MQVINRPPRTALEVFEFLPEGTLCEIINNTIYMAPPPSSSHQRSVTELSRVLGNYIKKLQLGEVFVSPIGVYFDNENVFEPDLVFVSKENKNRIEQKGIIGAPDFIVEILSPSNEHYDLTVKKDVYERYGVMEYWVVNPESKEAKGFALMNGKYELFSESRGKISSKYFNHEFVF